MGIKPTSVLCRKANAREVASSYCKTRGASEKWHALAARYLQLEGRPGNRAVVDTIAIARVGSEKLKVEYIVGTIFSGSATQVQPQKSMI